MQKELPMRIFLKDEAGFVAIEWVVMVALLTGLAIAVMMVVSVGAQDISTDMSDEMQGDIVSSNFPAADIPEPSPD